MFPRSDELPSEIGASETMGKFFSDARLRYLTVLWGSVIIIGLFLTRWVLVLPSVGMAGFFVTSAGYALYHGNAGQRSRWRLPLSFTLVYIVHLLAGVWHGAGPDNSLLKDLVLQLPFLLLPLSFWLLPNWQVWQKRFLWGVLLICCLVSAVAATANYLQHASAIAVLYNQSQVMPTEPDHPRFSLLISLEVFWAVLYLLHGGQARWVKMATLAVVLILFLFQHLLAARGGLISLYSAGLLVVGWLGLRLQRWRVTALISGVVVGMGLACLMLLPTLSIRVKNTFYDIAQASSTSSANNFSIAARLYSYEIIKTVIFQHPLLGVGKAQLPAEMAVQYSYQYPEITPDRYVLPHNQFVYNLAAYGIVGLLLFGVGYYYALWLAIRQRNLLAIGVYLIISLSFLGEYTLETNIGVIVGLFFPLLAIAPEAPESVGNGSSC